MLSLKDKILRKKAVISVVGLGYVGLPLAVEFLNKGFWVRGIELDKNRVSSLRREKSYILDLDDKTLGKAFKQGRFRVTTSYNAVCGSDVIIICVPTPLRKTGEPDITYILDSVKKIKKHLSKNMLIILESTTYPGTTEEVVLPILSKGELQVGRDFYLAFSPERIDPGNKKYQTANIPKVIGAVTADCLECASVLYKQIVNKVVTVSSPKTAEMAKLLENSFRSVNIALANEVAFICGKMGIDVWEVIKAAESKPFGYMPFYPGPGIGGHCIPTDPMYLIWKARLSGYEPKLIKTAHDINSFMPHHVVEKLIEELKKRKKVVRKSKVLIVGLSYKPDVNDIRESPALEIIKELTSKKVQVSFYDPYVKELQINGKKYISIFWKEKNIQEMDAVIIVTNHSNVDYGILKKALFIIDTRNALKGKIKNLVKL
ncbi:MAG: nucleotide sugar dehydrogenase [Candidatus Saelkia tenebricola]|nr:nucleotide sugar dehydrogenase [Candidatus Saelkia tenebricola]